MNGTQIRVAPRSRRALVLGLAAAIIAPAAHAVSFETEWVKGSFDSTISYGMQWRMQGRDCSIIGNDNGGCVPTTGTLGERVNGPGMGFTSDPDFNYLQADDGNLNFDKHDIVSAALKGTHELSLQFPQEWRALVRGSWLYDFRADHTRRTPLADDAKDIAARDVRLLDAWVSKDLDIAGRPAKFRVGNQVISWGEDIFIYGGINIINAIDLRRAHVPGTQLKEIFRPAPMASFNIGATNNLSVEGFYQFRWNAFEFDPVGSYFSFADVVGRGQQHAFVPSSILGAPPGTVGDVGTISNGAIIPAGQRFTLDDLFAIGTVVPKLDTRTPPNTGQWGLALRYKPEQSKAEWGFFYLRYHDKIPMVSFINDPSITANPFGLGYFVDYGKDRDLYGVSVNTHLGDWAVGAEISYRPRDSVAIDPTVPLAGPYAAFSGPGTYPGFVDEKKWQAHVTAIYLLGPSGDLGWLLRGLRAAEGTLLAEVAVTHYPNLDLSGAKPYLLTNYELPTKTSAGFVGELAVVYPHVLGSPVNFTPQIDVAYDFSGTSPNTIPFIKGRTAVTPSFNFEYLNRWRGQLAYTWYSGGGGNNLLKDRDFLSFNVSYSF
ncbi:MAG TPA: DUF1302 domain-containing protein [Casimicrobiaceae bacterium]